ncbi:kelch repeat and BTB domain-containing protein 3 [Trichomycterus rosablanca]|uniref:kelch repeat and BTB domain-containing protein 3 n=1 Tax=Trichomycterus rosablanca TaxID=2290929 RepID=UPI002F35312A
MLEVNMRERDDGSVTLNELSVPAVRCFLDFAYSGEMEITEENVHMLFQLSSFLQVDVISQACSDFLIQTLNLSNCIQLLNVAEGYGSTSLMHQATQFVVANFHALSSIPDFLEMPRRTLQHCLESDSLNVPDEESVLRALLCWTQHDQQTRRGSLPELLSLIRLHHLPPATLEEISQSEMLLLDSADCTKILKEALAQAKEFSGFFSDARPSTTSSYIFVHKTEGNGEVHHTFGYDVEANYWHWLPVSDLIDLPGSSITSFGEKIFVIGGCRGRCDRSLRLHFAESEHDATDEAWCFCPITGNIMPIPPMHHPRTMHTSVTALHRIYVIGGKTKGKKTPALLDVEYYDPLKRTWTLVSPLPCRIYFPEAAVCGSIIYTLGSELETSDAFNPSLNCFFRFNAKTNQWCQLVAEFGQLFHARLVKAVGVYEMLYLCDLSTYKLYSFCADSTAWKSEGSFECAGFNAGAVGIRNLIYILGGDYSPDEITDEVQVYHSGRREWKDVAPMPCPLTELHCQVISFNRCRDPWRSEATGVSKTHK